MSDYLQSVQKARLTLDYLASNGGALPEEVLDRFLVVTIESSDFLKAATVRKMKSTTIRLPNWIMGTRALHRRTRGTPLADSKKTTPTTAGPVMTAYDYGAEVTLEKEDLKSGVQGPGMLNLIMNTLTQRVNTDLADMYINGDTGSADEDYNAFNGFRVGVTSNTAAAGSTRMSTVNMTTLFKTMPEKFQTERLTVRTSINAMIDYGNAVQDRPTNLGDRVLEGKWEKHWHGVKMKGDMLMPQNLGGGNDTVAVLSDEKNFNIGIHQELESDNDKDIRAQTIVIVFTIRTGGMWAYQAAAAELTGVLAS